MIVWNRSPKAQLTRFDLSQEDLTPETTVGILKALAAGQTPKTGPQSNRRFSEPDGPLTSLIEEVSLCPLLLSIAERLS